MSLVAYDSSGDSDSDRDDKPRLLASLPPPKKKKTPTVTMMMELPRPRKRTEPVRIPAPEIRAADSDSDEDEPAPKKPAAQGSGGLSSLLPQPKNLLVKEAHRPLVPHSLTRRPGSEGPKAKSTPPSGPSPSPSAIKAAAKSAAMQLARQMAANEDGSDEEMAPENFFSLPEDTSQPAMPPDTDPAAVQNLEDEGPTHTDPYSGSTGPEYHVNAVPDTSPQEYYGEGYYPDPDPAGNEPEESGSSSMFNDEAFRRLQGKQNRGREEIKFLEIKGDDQLSGNKQWMTKNLTNEVEAQKSFSKKKGEQPTGQQRRKHQITYLIHQAKARELELKNSWAENKMSRRQTQAKYGF